VFRELLLQRVSQFCRLSAIQLDQLQQHYELMLRWNKSINLTRVEEVEDAVDRHYAESLFLGSILPPGRLSITDVGSGAGFPGIPIGVLRPDVTVCLIEAHQRKAVFLKEVARELPNFTVKGKRAQDVTERFDWAVSRAVSWRDIRELDLAPKLALIGTDAPGEFIHLPWAHQRKVVIVSRETKTVLK
jgi:16S rRNA (guanine527-N7)-methyltransferase